MKTTENIVTITKEEDLIVLHNKYIQNTKYPTSEQLADRYSKHYIFWVTFADLLKCTDLKEFTRECKLEAEQKLNKLSFDVKKYIDIYKLTSLYYSFSRSLLYLDISLISE